jgi:signal transduction histidine kinase
MTQLELKQEIRTYFFENGRSIGWTTLILPFGLYLVSDFENQMPSLFWFLTLLQITCAAGLSWLSAALPTWKKSELANWDQAFYSFRLVLYTALGTFLSALFFAFDPLSWPGLIAVGMLIGSIEVLIATFHPKRSFALLSLFILGGFPIGFGTLRLGLEDKNPWIGAIGFLYLLLATGKLFSLNRRFIQTAQIRSDNFKNQNRLASVLDAMPAKVSHLDSEFRYIEINQTMVDAYGKAKSDYIGQKVGFQDNKGASPLLNLLNSFKDSPKELIATEAVFKFKETEERLHTIQIKKIQSASDNCRDRCEYILVAVDISEQQKIKAQLENEKLRFAQAAKLSSVGEMAAGIAHEIKNPLTIILGNLTLLQREINSNNLNPEKLKTRLNNLIDTANRISQIISSMLRLTRSSGTSDHTWTPLTQVVMDPLALCNERFKVGNVSLTVDPTPNDLELLCDPQQIGQVLLNLLNNAFDATDGIKDQRQVTLSHSINKDGSLRLTVSDNGPGAKDPSQLFGSFYTTKRVGHGTGLGLSLCRRIMEQHKSQISYERANLKTSFILDFPNSQVRKVQIAA